MTGRPATTSAPEPSGEDAGDKPERDNFCRNCGKRARTTTGRVPYGWWSIMRRGGNRGDDRPWRGAGLFCSGPCLVEGAARLNAAGSAT